MNLKEAYAAINKVWRNFKYHNGRGGDAHPPVNDFLDGFMTVQQKKDLENAEGYRNLMPEGTDVLTVAPGLYEIVGATNNPFGPDDRTLLEYTVTQSRNDKTRHIVAITSNTGIIWHRTIHYDGTPESGTGTWVRQPVEMPVWSGVASNGTVVFNEPLTNFNGIAIEYASKFGNPGYVRHLGRANYTSISVTNLPNNTDDASEQHMELNYTIASDAKSLTINSNRCLRRAQGGESVWQDGDDWIKILRISGIK